MKKTLAILAISALLSSGCTYTQRTVTGGVMMGVGGVTAGVSGMQMAVNEDVSSGLNGNYYNPSNTGWKVGLGIGAVLFLVGGVILITGIVERNKADKK